MTKPADQLRPARRGAFRLSLRIARRDAAQHRGRSALIIALVAIPIIGLSALSTIFASNIPTTQETLRIALGGNQARLSVISAPDPNSSRAQPTRRCTPTRPVTATPQTPRMRHPQHRSRVTCRRERAS